MSCPTLCCKCCPCCEKVEKLAPNKYPHIEYRSPEDAIEGSDFYTVPLERFFGVPQTQGQYVIHPPDTDLTVTGQPGSTMSDASPCAVDTKLSSQASSSSLYQAYELPQELHSKTAVQRTMSLPVHPWQRAEWTDSPGSSTPTWSPASSTSTWVPPSLLSGDQSDVLSEQETSSCTLWFSVYYNIQQSLLEIQLQKVTQFSPFSSLSWNQSMLVVMHLDPLKEKLHQSILVLNSPTPHSNQIFRVKGLKVAEVRRQSLVFQVYRDTKVSERSFIGSAALPLGEADLFGVITTVRIDKTGKRHADCPRGDILLSLMYNPTRQLLQGTVMKIANLVRLDIVGQADPYVTIFLEHKGVRQVEWRTSVKRNTLTPIFNESFQFDVSEMDMNSITLEAVVMDFDRFSHSDQIGLTLIGKDVSAESGRSHWKEVITSSSVAVSHWHPVMPGSTGTRLSGSTM